MVTIYDVAKEAGVSAKTVSRVLNADAPVNEKTRERIVRTMDALGYVPSQAARMMRSNHSGLIGLITGAISGSPDPGEPTGLPDFYIVQAIQRELAGSGKILMIADTGGDSKTVPTLARTFVQHRVEGLIYVADYHREVALDFSIVSCPVVLVNCFGPGGTLAILPDDRACQAALVERIIRSGHRRIGFLTLDPEMPAVAQRVRGYRDALAAADIGFDGQLVVAAHERGHGLSSDLLTRSLARLLELDVPPTVICCGNDEMAMRAYGILRTGGLRVPDDVSVAGFDDNRAIAEMLFPPLTTVELPYRKMGRLAAETLAGMIVGGVTDTGSPMLVAGPVAWRSSVTSRSI